VSRLTGPSPALGVSRRDGLARSAIVLTFLAGVSHLLGFVRDAVIVAVFGVSAQVDAYLVAQGVMNLVLGLIAGAVAKALVPAVSRSVDAGDTANTRRVVQTVLTATILILVAGSAVMYVAARQVVTVLSPGFDPETADLAMKLTRIVLVATVFIAGTNILAAAAQAHRRFAWSGSQGISFNLVMIAAAGWFGGHFGIEALAVGFVVGSALRLVLQLPAVRLMRLRLRPALSLQDPGVREVAALVPALIVSSAITNVNTLVDRAVGSTQDEGTIAALSLGWRVVSLADSLLVAAFATVLFPAFSVLSGTDARQKLRQVTAKSVGVLLVVVCPIVAMLTAASTPVVQLLFSRGAFDGRAISMTALAVSAYAVALIGLAVRNVMARTSLAVGDSRSLVTTAACAMVINVVGDLTLGLKLGIVGLAASTSVSVLFAAVMLSILLARRHNAVDLASLGRTLLAIGSATACAAVATRAALWLWTSVGPQLEPGWLSALAAGAVATTACMLAYLTVVSLLRVPAARQVHETLMMLLRRTGQP
jgi:putative peptidoglycan lipid II flippase